MKAAGKAAVLREFQTIPGVGRTIAEDLWNLGLRSVGELRGRQPEMLYDQLCNFQGRPVDRCMLYVFRCAVYFVSTRRPDPAKLKWWYWKDARSKSANREAGG